MRKSLTSWTERLTTVTAWKVLSSAIPLLGELVLEWDPTSWNGSQTGE